MDDEFGLPQSNTAGYIRGLISEGVGPTEGLRAFRDEPFGHIQDSRWFELYKSVNEASQRSEIVLGLDPTSLPTADMYGTFESGSGGKYVTTIEMQMIDRATGDWFTQKTEFWTSDPHTIEEAEADALANWADPDAQNQYEITVMGAVATQIWQTTAFGG